MTDDNIERGAAEEGAQSPLTPTEVEASRTAPSQGSSGDGQQTSGEQTPGAHDEADSASNTDV